MTEAENMAKKVVDEILGLNIEAQQKIVKHLVHYVAEETRKRGITQEKWEEEDIKVW